MSEGGNFIAFAEGECMALVVPLLETLLTRNAKAQVQVFYGERSREQAASAEPLLALKDRYIDRLALHFVMSEEPQEIELLNGRLDAAKVGVVAEKFFDPLDVRQFILCGSAVMSAGVGGALRRLGVPPAHIHVEGQSAPGAVEVAKKPEVPADTDRTEVSVIMDGRRRSFSMRMNEESILEAAERAGLELPFSCKAGVCSTCRTKLLAGKVELAQNYALEDWELEQGFILACQARAKTPVLEITYDET